MLLLIVKKASERGRGLADRFTNSPKGLVLHLACRKARNRTVTTFGGMNVLVLDKDKRAADLGHGAGKALASE